VSKFVRLDDDHFAYLIDYDIRLDDVRQLADNFEHHWPGKQLVVIKADEFVDLTGRYELVPIPDDMAALA
jgi:hypothetical protein